MTNATLSLLLTRFRKIHTAEIGLRAGQTVNVLEELKQTREAIAPIIEAVKMTAEAGIFTEMDWNEEYTLNVNLTVKELRRLAALADPGQ